MKPSLLGKGDVVQLSPELDNRIFAGCMMIVSEPKSWGAQGYVQMVGQGKEDRPGGQAYLRVKWEDMEYVGPAMWEVE